MLATTLQSFASKVDEMLTKVDTTKQPLVIERKGENMVVISQSDYESLILFMQNKRSEQEEYIQLRDTFFQNSKQAMMNAIEKYLD
jgi:PHD/YefM family antitoxin component YafN of YafNO toxin-antitoxin module